MSKPIPAIKAITNLSTIFVIFFIIKKYYTRRRLGPFGFDSTETTPNRNPISPPALMTKRLELEKSGNFKQIDRQLIHSCPTQCSSIRELLRLVAQTRIAFYGSQKCVPKTLMLTQPNNHECIKECWENTHHRWDILT